MESANNDNGTTNIFLSETLMWGFGSDELKWEHFGLIFDNEWFVIWFVHENRSGERTRKWILQPIFKDLLMHTLKKIYFMGV